MNFPALSRHAYSHDYNRLIRRWRAVAKSCRLRMKVFSESGELPIVCIEARTVHPERPFVYFSAGIHGDEPAATEALVTWAEDNPRLLAKIQPLIFPCLNPWGLVNNSRFDSRGRDLNRSYNLDEVPQVLAHLELLRGKHFALALLLHEDFDAQGMYVYEVSNRRPFFAEEMLRASSRHVPIDGRRRIERRVAREGVIRQRVTKDLMPYWPEAFSLHFHHADRTFTIETPSEFHICQRVAGLMEAMTTAIQLTLRESS